MSIVDSIIENEYLQFLFIFIITIIITLVIFLILRYIFTKIVDEKKYSKYLLKKLSKPITLFIFILGLYIALKFIDLLSKYTFNLSGNNYIILDALFFVIIIFTISFLISRIINVLMFGLAKAKKGFDKPPGLINKLVTFIIYVIAIFIILGYLQLDITPMIAGVGLGALAIGLALQSTLSNFFAGVHIISDKPINVGDFIELDEKTTGIVEDVGWRSTRIRMLTDNLLIIPNGKLAESNIINCSLPKQDMSIWIPCGVSYESNLKYVEKITLEVAKEIQKTIPGAVKDFEPTFRFKEFGDSNINFITVLRINDPMKRFTVRSEFIKALKERYDKEKIEISWPIRKIYSAK